MTSKAVEEEARRLPREPTGSWIVGLFVLVAALWLGVLFWQIGALPPRVPTQFGFDGTPTSWTSKTSALVSSTLTAAVVTLPALLVSPLTLRAPGVINAPNQRWWTASPSRLRRFERLLREDLLLFASAALFFLSIAEAGITVAAISPEAEFPLAFLAAMLAPALALIVVFARMCGAGGRYDEQPEGGADELALRYPDVQVRSSDLYIDHGDVITSAGTASSLDACLHIVRMHLGATAAAAVARHIVVAPHREGDQAQYIQRPLPENGDGGAIGETIEWALSHLDANLSVDELARRACMSRRSFARRFLEVTGTSPGRWVLSRRLDHARMLLETTAWPIDAIATECGFGSVVTFRQNFVRAFSTSPTSYRSRFGGADAQVTR